LNPFATWNPARCVWESGQELVCGHVEPYSAIWPTSGSMRNGQCFRRPPWELPIAANGSSSLLPTPQARDGDGSNRSMSATTAHLRHNVQGKRNLDDAIALLPTPRTSDMHGTGEHGTGGLDLRTAISLLPTPRASDGEKGGPNQRGSSGDLMLPSAVMLLPTATAMDSRSSGKGQSLSHGTTLTDAVRSTGATTDQPSSDGNESSDDGHPPRLF